MFPRWSGSWCIEGHGCLLHMLQGTRLVMGCYLVFHYEDNSQHESFSAGSQQLLFLVLQIGVLVQHREACRSVLSFLTRLFDPQSALAALQQQAGPDQAAAIALLEQQVGRIGQPLIRMLLGAAVGALPASRVEELAPVLQAILKLAGPKGVMQWIQESVMQIPEFALTNSDKEAFLTAAAAVMQGNAGMDGGCEGLEEALEVVSDLCRRNKRAMKAAQAALLPPQLHAQLSLAV
eukprot:GHUV01039777.1.p1 GENE.GHUV01039777.1~~GHUV01039777.1.p1  ORF type:complete len:235 (+),score=27.93 GHUV01039777.1:2-706(+)